MVASKLKALLRPEGFLLAAAVLLASINRLEDSAADLVRLAPPAVGLAGLIVAWRLRRSRLVFSLTVLGLGYLLVSRWASGDANAFQLAALLVPLNLAAIALLPERGAFIESGLWHWGALLAEAAVAARRATAWTARVYTAADAGSLVIAAVEVSYELAYHDGLTGLPGRRALNEALERLSGAYTIAMVDVDHFKHFNDAYGHDVGDDVLRTVATRLADALPEGLIYRYGGEEFTVLFGGASCDTCVPLLERAREAVA